MGEEILSAVIKQVCEYDPDSARFIWHGGEPLLAGIDFYEKVVELQDKFKHRGQKIINEIQTNGTLLNENWADFFKSNSFRIGVSLDGSKIENEFRKFPNGTNSFNNAWRGIQILKQKGVNFGILTVIHSKNVNQPDKVFDFLVNSGLKIIGFNKLIANGHPQLKMAISDKGYSNFIKRIFDLWIEKDDPAVRIREISNIIRGLLGKSAQSCQFTQGCGRYLTIEYNGNVYPCDRYDYFEKIHLGNIEKDGIEKILNSNPYKNYCNKITESRLECNNCKWYYCCQGGCAADHLLTICEGLKDIFQHIDKKLQLYNIYNLKKAS